jgi:hypothetical protein
MQRVLDVLDEYGPTSVQVMSLILDPIGKHDEGFLQLLHHLEHQGAIAVMSMTEVGKRPLVFIERI